MDVFKGTRVVGFWMLAQFCGATLTVFCEDAFDEIVIDGASTIQPGINCVEILGRHRDTKIWQSVPPSDLKVEISGDACFVKDPSGDLTNPFMVAGIGDTNGEACATVLYRDAIRCQKKFRVASVRPKEKIILEISPEQHQHRFDGMGGGLMFYDNQWDLSDGDELFQWCEVAGFA